jgi:hypothetical protein
VLRPVAYPAIAVDFVHVFDMGRTGGSYIRDLSTGISRQLHYIRASAFFRERSGSTTFPSGIGSSL